MADKNAADYLVDGKYTISDLIDIEELKTIFEKFNEATGFTIGFLDHPEKNVLICAGWRNICTKFHRSCPVAAECCRKSNAELLDALNEPGLVRIEECDNGLVDCATPIVIKGKHIASLATGQFLLKPPDLDRFRRRAKAFGFEEEEYLAAVKEVPVLDEEKVKKVTAFLGELAVVVSELGYARLQFEEEAVRLEEEVCERRRIEDALKYEKERAQSFLNIAGVMIVAIDADQKVILVNKKACEVLRCREEDIVGKNWFENFVPRDDRERVSEAFATIVSGDVNPWHHMENRVVTRDGEERLIAWHNTFLREEGRRVVSLSSGEDITDQRRAEEENIKLMEAVQKAEKLESLGILAGGIAHDFNNLLTGIFGFIDLARITSDGPPSAYIEKALTALDRARNLTHQLLTFAKGGAPVKQCAPLFPFVTDTALFALSGTAIKLEADIQEDLWLCQYDNNQMGQAIDNIVINSIQAMPIGGTLTVRARNVTIGNSMAGILPEGNYVRLSLIDTGVGMPAEIRSRIFDPFFTTKQKGSGLGLASVYSIIKRHAGHVEVESTPGVGTAFHVYLPASDSVVIAAEKAVDSHSIGSGTVLVMDDERMIQDVTRGMLEELGYSVLTADDGGGLIDLLREQKSHGKKTSAIILDLTITGGLGGRETAAKIRELDKSVPPFVASGYADDPIMADPGEYGFNGSLRKPFMLNDIASLLSPH